MFDQNSRLVSTSIAVVGSSSTISSHSPAIASANLTRWVWPPDSLSTRWSANLSIPACFSVASTGSGRGCRLATRLTSSRTVTSGISPPDCSIAPTRPDLIAWYGSLPNIRIRPEVGFFSARSMSREVDLPAPFGPRRATVSPGRRSRLSPSTAFRPPYCLLTFSNETTGPVPLLLIVLFPLPWADRATRAGRWFRVLSHPTIGGPAPGSAPAQRLPMTDVTRCQVHG